MAGSSPVASAGSRDTEAKAAEAKAEEVVEATGEVVKEGEAKESDASAGEVPAPAPAGEAKEESQALAAQYNEYSILKPVEVDGKVVQFTESALLERGEMQDQNKDRQWYELQSWNFKHTTDALDFRKKAGYGLSYSDSHFGPEYDRAGLVRNRGKPRSFPNVHPMDRYGRYTPMPIEGRMASALLESYYQSKLIRVGYLAALGAAAYASHYLSIVEEVPLPENFECYDNGTGTSVATKMFLPDFKLLDVVASDRDAYVKKYTASAFSCPGFYPYRKAAGMMDVKYYARAYHLHFRRRIQAGEFFGDYELYEKDRTTTLLRSQLFGTLAQCRAEVDDDGCLLLQLSTVLPNDHWSQRHAGTFYGDYLLAPTYTQFNKLLTRAWLTSSANFFLRHHCSEVYIKPLNASQNMTVIDKLA